MADNEDINKVRDLPHQVGALAIRIAQEFKKVKQEITDTTSVNVAELEALIEANQASITALGVTISSLTQRLEALEKGNQDINAIALTGARGQLKGSETCFTKTFELFENLTADTAYNHAIDGSSYDNTILNTTNPSNSTEANSKTTITIEGSGNSNEYFIKTVNLKEIRFYNSESSVVIRGDDTFWKSNPLTFTKADLEAEDFKPIITFVWFGNYGYFYQSGAVNE